VSPIPDLEASALLVVDAQAGVAAGMPRADGVIAVIAGVVDRARLAGVPVVWLRRTDADLRVGEPGWQVVDALAPEPAEQLVDHAWDDAFADTDLAHVVSVVLEAGHCWIVGLGSDAGVLRTYLGAQHRGLAVTLVEDAHCAADVEFDGCRFSARQVAAFVNRLAWRDVSPGVTGDLVSSATIEFADDGPDDTELIARAEEETAAIEQALDDRPDGQS